MGGEGSGRKPDVVKQIIEQRSPVGILGRSDGFFLPNYSGIQEAALKTSAPLSGSSGSGDNWFTSGSNVLWPKNNESLSGANVYATGNISGAFIYGDGSNLTGITGGTGDNWFTSGSSTIWPKNNESISGANLYAVGNISGAFFYGDGSNLDNLPAGSESDPIWTAASGAFAKDANLTYVSGSHFSLSGQYFTNIPYLSGQLFSLSGQYFVNVPVISGAVYSLSGSVGILSGAYYTHKDLATNPHGSTLTQTTLLGTTISGTTFTASGLVSGARMTTDDLSGGYIFTPTLSGSQINTNIISGGYMYGFNHSGANFYASNLSGGYVYAPFISGANMIVGTSFSGGRGFFSTDITASGSAYVPNIVHGTNSGSYTASSFPQGTILMIYT